MELNSLPIVGVVFALVSAAALTVGNLLQSRGIRTMNTRSSAEGSAVSRLIRNRVWVLGGGLLVVAVVLQMASLLFAPLIVVQPIGVSALVFTVLLSAVATKTRPPRAVVRDISICVLGVAAFVTVAAVVGSQHAVTDTQLIAVLVLLIGVLVATGTIVVLGRARPTPPILWVLFGGVFSAFVATLGKTVILRVQTALKTREFAWDSTNALTIGCIIGIGVAALLSIYFVQRAHALNRPEVVVAGLTVIDPTVAVVVGITILGEASEAPAWAFTVFALAGAVAIAGVFMLSRAEQTSDPVSEEAR